MSYDLKLTSRNKINLNSTVKFVAFTIYLKITLLRKYLPYLYNQQETGELKQVNDLFTLSYKISQREIQL